MNDRHHPPGQFLFRERQNIRDGTAVSMGGEIVINVNAMRFVLYFAISRLSKQLSAVARYLVATTRKKRGSPLAAVADR